MASRWIEALFEKLLDKGPLSVSVPTGDTSEPYLLLLIAVKDGKVYVESNTLQSLFDSSSRQSPVVTDISNIDNVISEIIAKQITTTILFGDDIDFQILAAKARDNPIHLSGH